MDKVTLTTLAKQGLVVRRQQLEEEIARLRELEAELDGGRPMRRSRRPAMSAAAKKAVSERMKKYWAERRKQANRAK